MEGVDFLIDLHDAEARRQGRARAPGHQNAGNQRREFPDHGKGDADGHLAFGAENPQRVDTLNGQHDADCAGHDGDDRQRPDADLHHLGEDRADADGLLVIAAGDQPENTFGQNDAACTQFLDAGNGRSAHLFGEPADRVPGFTRRHVSAPAINR